MSVHSSKSPRQCPSGGAQVSEMQRAAKCPRYSTEAAALIRWFEGHRNVAVAFSGGVDSSVVLAAAHHCASSNVTAITADSPSVARWQLDLACEIATRLGVSHRVVPTAEVELSAYNVNDSQRCYHCKNTLYAVLDQLCESQLSDDVTVVSGTNADDLGDYRPGIAAGDQHGVKKPLAELGYTKTIVRKIAAEFGLPNQDLPASPCLASRIAYGVKVTPERLRRVEQAEDHLRSLGMTELRVRLHDGELARVEVPLKHLPLLTSDPIRSRLTSQLMELGFRYVTIDLLGFSSGSMNRQIVPLQSSVPKATVHSQETS